MKAMKAKKAMKRAMKRSMKKARDSDPCDLTISGDSYRYMIIQDFSYCSLIFSYFYSIFLVVVLLFSCVFHVLGGWKGSRIIFALICNKKHQKPRATQKITKYRNSDF